MQLQPDHSESAFRFPVRCALALMGYSLAPPDRCDLSVIQPSSLVSEPHILALITQQCHANPAKHITKYFKNEHFA